MENFISPKEAPCWFFCITLAIENQSFFCMIEPSSTRIALVISVLFFCFADGFAKSKTPEYDEQQTINRLEKMPNDLFRPKGGGVTLA